jgi:hypothetical protein
MAETNGGPGGDGIGSTGGGGVGDSSTSTSGSSVDSGLSSTDFSTSGMSADPSVTTTVTASPIVETVEPTVEPAHEPESLDIPEARWEDKGHIQDSFNNAANQTSAESTAHKQTGQGSASEEKPRDEFWKNPDLQVPGQNPNWGSVSQEQLAALEKQRPEPEPGLHNTIGGTVEQAESQKSYNAHQNKINYVKGRLKAAHEKARDDFDRSR